MIVDSGIAKIVDDMVDLIVTGAISSSSTDPSATATTVVGQLASASLDDTTASKATFTTKYFVSGNDGAGATVRKTQLYTDDGTLFSDDKHPDFTKTASDTLTYFHKITLRRGT